MNLKLLFIAAFVFGIANTVACTTDTKVVIEDHYGECMADEQCPGTSVCLDGICVEPDEPAMSCDQLDWMGYNSTWYCWCDGDNCIGTNAELPWSCPMDLLEDTQVCGVQCHDHFWLSDDMIFIDRLGNPPRIVIDDGNGVVTCTQYADVSPLRFVRSQTRMSLSVDAANNTQSIVINFQLTHPGIVFAQYRFNPGDQWAYAGLLFTYDGLLAQNHGLDAALDLDGGGCRLEIGRAHV